MGNHHYIHDRGKDYLSPVRYHFFSRALHTLQEAAVPWTGGLPEVLIGELLQSVGLHLWILFLGLFHAGVLWGCSPLIWWHQQQALKMYSHSKFPHYGRALNGLFGLVPLDVGDLDQGFILSSIILCCWNAAAPMNLYRDSREHLRWLLALTQAQAVTSSTSFDQP